MPGLEHGYLAKNRFAVVVFFLFVIVVVFKIVVAFLVALVAAVNLL